MGEFLGCGCHRCVIGVSVGPSLFFFMAENQMGFPWGSSRVPGGVGGSTLWVQVLRFTKNPNGLNFLVARFGIFFVRVFLKHGTMVYS